MGNFSDVGGWYDEITGSAKAQRGLSTEEHASIEWHEAERREAFIDAIADAAEGAPWLDPFVGSTSWYAKKVVRLNIAGPTLQSSCANHGVQYDYNSVARVEGDETGAYHNVSASPAGLLGLLREIDPTLRSHRGWTIYENGITREGVMVVLIRTNPAIYVSYV